MCIYIYTYIPWYGCRSETRQVKNNDIPHSISQDGLVVWRGFLRWEIPKSPWTSILKGSFWLDVFGVPPGYETSILKYKISYLSFYLSIYLFHLSIYSIYRSILFIYLSIYLSIYLLHLSIFLSIYLSIYLTSMYFPTRKWSTLSILSSRAPHPATLRCRPAWRCWQLESSPLNV